jgi:anaphase-promoting complex subunit 3
MPFASSGGLALPNALGDGSGAVPGPKRKFVDEGKLRKVSNKLFSEPASVLKELRWHGQGGEGSGGGGAEGGATLADVAVLPGLPRGQRSAEGQAQALPLLHALGDGYRLLCMYRWLGSGGRADSGGLRRCSCFNTKRCCGC